MIGPGFESGNSYLQGNHVQGWPGKITSSRKLGLIFHCPECFENMTNYLNFMGILTNFPLIYASKEGIFPSKEGILRQKLGFMRPSIKILDKIFTAARKFIFGNMITLIFQNLDFNTHLNKQRLFKCLRDLFLNF